MEYLRRALEDAIQEEIVYREKRLRTVSPDELRGAQQFIFGLERGLQLVNEQFERFVAP